MDSITQNWPWILIALAAGAFFFLRSRRGGHGGHRHDAEGERDGAANSAPVVPDATIDPVSGAAVRTAGAPNAFYRGRIYYFASKENRDRFEASAEEFASKTPGVATDGSAPSERPRRRRSGC